MDSPTPSSSKLNTTQTATPGTPPPINSRQFSREADAEFEQFERASAEQELSTRPPTKYALAQHYWAHCKRNPLAPLGIGATVWALYMAVQSLRRGDSRNFQKYLRMRVGAQAFAFVALIGGGIYYDEAKPWERIAAIPGKIDRVHEKTRIAKVKAEAERRAQLWGDDDEDDEEDEDEKQKTTKALRAPKRIDPEMYARAMAERRSAEADPTDPLPVLVPAAASTPASGETAEDKKTRVAREVEEFLRRRERGADQGRRQGEGSLGLGK